MSFGHNLTALREQSGLTRKELAERLDLPYTTLRNYETDQREPGYQLLRRMAAFFSVTVDELLGEGGAARPRPAAPACSEEALRVARDYEGLDRHGRNLTRILIAEEQKRMAEERRRRETGEEEGVRRTRVIPLYYTPAAAGMTSPAAGEDFDYIEVGSDTASWKADFAVKIDGDSMEPYIQDGSTGFVNREPLENGDVGIFCVDGDMICKQYYKDEEGNVRLLSLNRARRSADRFLSHRDNDTVLTYYGRVILPRRPLVSMA